jgi:hypothetical protein
MQLGNVPLCSSFYGSNLVSFSNGGSWGRSKLTGPGLIIFLVGWNILKAGDWCIVIPEAFQF